MEKKFRCPAALGACADLLHTLREQRLKLQKEVDAVAANEQLLKEHLIQTLPKSKASGVAGKLVRVLIINKTIPVVKDWPAFYKYVKRTGQFDLMQRRLADSAVAERWEAGKQIPGVEHFVVPTISMNKL